MSLQIRQSLFGYRYSLDALLLANFCALRPGTRVLEIGSGCGVITLILAGLWPDAHFTGIEIQSELINLAKQNLRINAPALDIKFIHGDIRKISHCLPEKSRFDFIVSNPPYRKRGSGRINIHQGKASARHEITGTLDDFIDAGSRLLIPKGCLYLIYTADRMAELLNKLINHRIEPKILRTVHPRKATESNLVLIKGVSLGKTGTRILPPLYIYKKNGEYTEEMKKIFKGLGFNSGKSDE